MVLKLANRVRVATSTTGTGVITLGSAVSGFQSFADGGIADGDVVPYVIEDGSAWEVGLGTYASSGTTLTRTTVLESSNADAAISLSGSAEVFISPLKQTMGWQLHAFNQPTSDVSSILVTGISKFNRVRVMAVLEQSTFADSTLSFRTSGGTWRDVHTGGSNQGLRGLDALAERVNEAETKLVSVKQPLSAGPDQFDDSDGINPSSASTELARAGVTAVTYDEIWDEVKIEVNTGSFEGSSSNRRGYFAVWGQY